MKLNPNVYFNAAQRAFEDDLVCCAALSNEVLYSADNPDLSHNVTLDAYKESLANYFKPKSRETGARWFETKHELHIMRFTDLPKSVVERCTNERVLALLLMAEVIRGEK